MSFLNETMDNITTSTTTQMTTNPEYNKRKSTLCLLIVVVFLVVGAFGNFLALLILGKKKNSRNTKYTLMLRCLATNNLIALMGMLIQLLLKIYFPSMLQKGSRWNCVSMVVWRFFGLNSGCIAAVMAFERWMALARPFTYHKHITYHIVKTTIQILGLIAIGITFMPFTGFGVYFDEDKQTCLRYRDATELFDITYAYFFMAFGSLLCTVIVVCNLFVARVLCFIGHRKSSKKSFHYDLVNRDKEPGRGYLNRTKKQTTTKDCDGGVGGGNTSLKGNEKFCNGRTERGGSGGGSQNIFDINNSFPSLNHQSSITQSTSSDEIRFAKLMTFLSISFVICWMPQMIAVPLALMANPLDKSHWFFRIADILMALHFTSDPYIYVISRTKYSFKLDCIKSLRRWFSSSNGGSTFGMKRNISDQNRLRPTNLDNTIDYGLNS